LGNRRLDNLNQELGSRSNKASSFLGKSQFPSSNHYFKR